MFIKMRQSEFYSDNHYKNVPVPVNLPDKRDEK